MQNDQPFSSAEFLSSVKVGFYFVVENRFAYVSPACEKLTGYSSGELIGADPGKCIHPEDRLRVDSEIRKVSGGENADAFDYRLIQKDGKIIWVLSTLFATWHNGKKALAGTLMDITGRRMAEEEMRRSEMKYRSILNGIQEVYFELDLQGNILFSNDALSRHLGYTQKEIAEMHYRQYTDETSRERVFKAFHDLYLTGVPVKALEETIVRKDGTRGIFELSISLNYDAAGNPVGFAGISRDVTDRRQMEETIRQSEERYRTIINEMDEWYFETDLNGNLLFYNEAIARTLGYRVDSLDGLNFRKLIGHKEADGVYLLFHRVFETGLPLRNAPYQFVRPDGSVIHAEFSIFAKRDQNGKITGFRAVGHDITEKKKAQQQQMLSEKMASISRLAAGAAHEIHYPISLVGSNLKTLSEYLTDIAAFIKLLQSLPESMDGKTPAEGDCLDKQLKNIKRLETDTKLDFVLEDLDSLIKESQEGVERIARIVHDLETYGQQGDEQPDSSDINEILEAALNGIWKELKDKAAVVREYGELPKINCHSGQLRQVFINLLTNAAQAITDEGEIKISTGVDPKGNIEIKIQDNGGGIPEEHLAKIFDPFFTTSEARNRTGLGLHVAFSIIDRHRGTIAVESKAGVGTTFRITLPSA